MTQDEVKAIVNSALEAHKADNSISISKEAFNGFMQTIGSHIKDSNVKAVFNSKVGLEKLSFLDTAMSLKDIFNSEEAEKADEPKENEDKEDEEKEALKVENSALKEKIAMLEKKNSESEDAKEDKEDEPKENEAEEAKEDDKDSESESEAKQNSVAIAGAKAVKNSADPKYAEIASQIFL